MQSLATKSRERLREGDDETGSSNEKLSVDRRGSSPSCSRRSEEACEDGGAVGEDRGCPRERLQVGSRLEGRTRRRVREASVVDRERKGGRSFKVRDPLGLVAGGTWHARRTAEAGSDVAEVESESLGGRARSRRGYAAISCLPRGRCRALRNSPGATPTQRSRWCASGFQGRTPLGIHVEVVCRRTGDKWDGVRRGST